MSSALDGGKDEDCLFLERVLDSLYDFGSETKKKFTTQKKKKRKRCEEEEEEELHTVKETCSDNEHSIDAEVQQPNTELKGPSMQLQNKVEMVTFQDPRKKTKTKQSPVSTRTPAQSGQDSRKAEQKQINLQEQLSLEKARLEVHRFGITGYKKEQQRVFEQDRAIMLGARPPKKEYVNYKVLQEQIKEKKQKKKEELHPDKKKKKKSNQRDNKKQPASGSGSGSGVAPSGQVGRFKNGMLILSSKEIQKIKGKK